MPVISQRGIEIPSSPIRKLTPLANNAKARGIKVYHLNIGQPDIIAPEVALNAVKENTLKLVEYPNSAGNESYLRFVFHRLQSEKPLSQYLLESYG